MAQDTPQRSIQTSHKITNEELENLQRYFTEVLELPENRIEASWLAWKMMAVISSSLDSCVLEEWVARELKERGKLQYDVKVFPLAKVRCIY